MSCGFEHRRIILQACLYRQRSYVTMQQRDIIQHQLINNAHKFCVCVAYRDGGSDNSLPEMFSPIFKHCQSEHKCAPFILTLPGNTIFTL